jgi:predicted TIM-barrel fold metal-dependent hydrolase
MESDELICFSTDYPRWDFDSPLEPLPADLSPKILSDNARSIYNPLPKGAPVAA